jgi:hypothetical protein
MHIMTVMTDTMTTGTTISMGIIIGNRRQLSGCREFPSGARLSRSVQLEQACRCQLNRSGQGRRESERVRIVRALSSSQKYFTGKIFGLKSGN